MRAKTNAGTAAVSRLEHHTECITPTHTDTQHVQRYDLTFRVFNICLFALTFACLTVFITLLLSVSG